ncbi:hypothetical protein [Aeromonas phage Riv-10]|uniref:Uncharacterized protein n=2 Tax=Biquartavirus 44RR2 TaxID=115987 RepID=Q6U9H7_9CAUD|nr:hypothetical protein ST44RRORF125c [Aeromonas phage 44RR2.8t]AAQ81444.1 hypothetical protein 44RRORF125c [Aeromonas phage 44RR2.8t]APU00597.1 hypothetical protein [Aeromonas phage 44RR2.8t.2]APU02179.1 hypothetical protein [Aeromonas phage Riv-10]
MKIYHPQHIAKVNGITKVDMIRGHYRFGISCWIMFKNDQVIDCTFKNDTAQFRSMEKAARQVAAKHQYTL